MCGVVALLGQSADRVREADVLAMTHEVAHRGPDGWGACFLDLDTDPSRAVPVERPDEQAWSVALGHRRLSILDLSEAGRQPMSYRGCLWVTYNGEIYNYVELRQELERLGHRFNSQTDTEVLLAAYDEWGTACFGRLRGMWGLVLVDPVRRVAVLSRDRLGIKPLYTVRHGASLAVVSEIKQLAKLPGYALRPDPGTVGRYLLTGFEDSRESFFEGVRPLPAGTFAVYHLDSGRFEAPEPYWFPERVQVEVERRDEASRRLKAALTESVRIHLRSDVPVGCALSGGLDSSAVAALIREVEGDTAARLHTFNATFTGEAIDERRYVDDVVPTVRANPHFTTPTAQGFVEETDRFLWHHDEPVGSLSQYAGFCVARITREAGVPVTLNGQGGDEVLSAYWQCYFVFLMRLLRRRGFRELGAQLAGALLPSGNAEVWRQAPAMLRRYRSRRAPDKLLTLRHPLVRDSAGGKGPADRFRDMSAAAWRVYEIRELTLPRLLKWDDRNFMAFSVEGRYPFLDHDVIETCLSLAPETLYARGWVKEPLRRALEGKLPRSIVRRRSKLGFETPQDRWLGSTLRRPIETLVANDSPAWAYVEPASARALADRTRDLRGAGNEASQAMLRLFLVDRWMRLYALG